ncbi:hypothetical protein NE237_020581 [Protea cynaroides]|uniref:Uncharacterized protein n=1 Tax=Protea cynaroides TaxID=273540 RepID=A0A9Q0H8P3_9MAGN|nr:hypothetical protein NE237_020581 [Protea cynaroides]
MCGFIITCATWCFTGRFSRASEEGYLVSWEQRGDPHASSMGSELLSLPRFDIDFWGFFLRDLGVTEISWRIVMVQRRDPVGIQDLEWLQPRRKGVGVTGQVVGNTLEQAAGFTCMGGIPNQSTREGDVLMLQQNSDRGL